MKILKCKECKKSFTKASLLNRHMLHHTGEKPYSCSICGKSFSQRSSTQRHESTVHSRQRPHKCKKCTKAFKTKQALNNHMVCHTGVRPYNCDDCGKSFLYETSLRNHLLLHTGEKPYSCNVTQVGRLRRHLLTGIHNNGLEKYQYCEDSLTSVSDNCKDDSRHMKDQSSKKQDGDKNSKKSSKHSSRKVLRDISGAKTQPQNNKGKKKMKDKGDSHHAFRNLLKQTDAKESKISACIRNETKSHSCRQCGKTFTTEAGILCHKQIHPNKKLLKGRKYGSSNREGSNVHVKKQTAGRNYKLKCDISGITTLRQSDLKRHIKQYHAEERPNRELNGAETVTVTPKVHKVEGIVESTIHSHKSKEISTSDAGLNGDRIVESELKEVTEPQLKEVTEPLINGITTNEFDTKEHTCIVCSSMFSNFADLTQHMQVHSWENAPSLSYLY